MKSQKVFQLLKSENRAQPIRIEAIYTTTQGPGNKMSLFQCKGNGKSCENGELWDEAIITHAVFCNNSLLFDSESPQKLLWSLDTHSGHCGSIAKANIVITVQQYCPNVQVFCYWSNPGALHIHSAGRA